MEPHRAQPAVYAINVPNRSCSITHQPQILRTSLAFSSDPFDARRRKIVQKPLGTPNSKILTKEKMPILVKDTVDPEAYNPAYLSGKNSYNKKQMEDWIDYFSGKYGRTKYGTKLDDYRRWLVDMNNVFLTRFGPDWLDKVREGVNFTD